MSYINADFLDQDCDLEQKYSKDLGSINTLINRELSWISFNWRVLQEANNKKVPLFERLRFLQYLLETLMSSIRFELPGLGKW